MSFDERGTPCWKRFRRIAQARCEHGQFPGGLVRSKKMERRNWFRCLIGVVVLGVGVTGTHAQSCDPLCDPPSAPTPPCCECQVNELPTCAAPNPETQGEWEPVLCWGADHSSIHAILLKTGKVLCVFQDPTEAWLFDPITETITDLVNFPPETVYCSGPPSWVTAGSSLPAEEQGMSARTPKP